MTFLQQEQRLILLQQLKQQLVQQKQELDTHEDNDTGEACAYFINLLISFLLIWFYFFTCI